MTARLGRTIKAVLFQVHSIAGLVLALLLALIARLKAAQDAGKVSAVTLSSDPAAAVHVRFARDDQGSRPGSLYVDPHDARVLGSPRGETFFATVRRLHRWLLIPGDAKGWGRPITGTIALGLIVMLASGLVLRWPRRASSVKKIGRAHD